MNEAVIYNKTSFLLRRCVSYHRLYVTLRYVTSGHVMFWFLILAEEKVKEEIFIHSFVP